MMMMMRYSSSSRASSLLAARSLAAAASGSRTFSSRVLAFSRPPRVGAERGVPLSGLVAHSRTRYALGAGTITRTAAGSGSSRSLSLWPFSSSSSSPPSNNSTSPSPSESPVSQLLHTEQSSEAATTPSPDAVAAGTAAAAGQKEAATSTSSSSLAQTVGQTDASSLGSSQGIESSVHHITTSDSVQQAMVHASEHVATLDSLGKLSSWPNVHYAQQMLDWVVETTGLPWWATIAVLTVAIRVAVFPIAVKGQANAIRLGNINPEMQRHMANINAAKAEGDIRLMTESTQKVQKLMKDNNCNPLKSFITPLVQAPLFMTLFFALKGLAGAGLSSMQTGGLLWFKDISVADPTAILPVLAAGLTLATLETGAEMGTGGGAKTTQQIYMRNGLRIILVALIPFTWNLPAAVFCYWSTNNIFSLLQLLFLQQPGVRRWLKLPAKKDRSAEDENDVFKPKKPSYFSKLQKLSAPAAASSSNKGSSTSTRPSSSAAVSPSPAARSTPADNETEANRNRALRRLAAEEAENAAEAAALTEDPTTATTTTTTTRSTSSETSDDPYAITMAEQLEREQARKSEEKRLRVAAARQRKQQKKPRSS